MTKLLILEDQADTYQKHIQLETSELEITALNQADEVSSSALQAEILLANPKWAARVVPHMPQLQWLQSSWAGVDALFHSQLTLPAAVTGLKNIFESDMAEYVLSYALARSQRHHQRQNWKIQKCWQNHLPQRLSGQTAVIVGCGNIGCGVASALHGLGVSVIGVTQGQRLDTPAICAWHTPETMLPALQCADMVISLLPATAKTQRFWNAQRFAQLRADVLFINAGRGSTLSQPALCQWLRSNPKADAVLDVVEPEPLPQSSPLWHIPNLQLSFHSAAVSRIEDVIQVFLDNFKRYQEHLPLLYRIDPQKGY